MLPSIHQYERKHNMQFQKYTHLERIEKEECDGILNGTCYIQSKIDGTNASVYMRNGELKAGSRTRELTLDNDNQGFYKYVLTNSEPFLSLFSLLPNAVLYGEWLCLSGDTVIKKTSAGKKTNYMTLREMYKYSTAPTLEKYTYTTKEGEKQSTSERQSWWRRYGFPSIFSLYHDEDKIKSNKIQAIVYTGDKVVYEVKTRKGFSIKATKNHPFFTPNGYVPLENLRNNDTVAVTTLLSSNRKRRTYGAGTNKIFLAQKEYKDSINRCETCGNKTGLEMHHKDRNHNNNSQENFMVICRDCHIKIHKNDCKFTGFEYEYEFDKIVSITYVGIEDCYDITMSGDENTANFVANGFIVHNCPHTIKSYRPDAWRKFYAFDMALVKGDELEYLRPQQYEPVLETLGIPFVPTIAIVQDYNGDFSEFAQSARFLLDESIADAHPEGIVIKNFDFRNKYGRNTFAKIVYESFKETKKTQVALTSTVEKDIAEKYVTFHFVQKELAKLRNDGIVDGLQGRLLQVVFRTVIQEEILDILKKFKNPIIDFKELNRAVTQQVKLNAKELF